MRIKASSNLNDANILLGSSNPEAPASELLEPNS